MKFAGKLKDECNERELDERRESDLGLRRERARDSVMRQLEQQKAERQRAKEPVDEFEELLEWSKGQA